MNSEPKRILYAEDEVDIQQVTLIALETIGGYLVKVCNSGLEAVEAARDFKPDLLLLDVMMPEMDGPTALRAIRELPGLAEVPSIFMTAKIQPHEIDEYEQMGTIDVIPKPFDPMTLAERINKIWLDSN